MSEKSWLDQVGNLPPTWSLTAVTKNKRPYHPDTPKGEGWQQGLDRDRFSTLNGQFGAIGLILGVPSGGIVAIDHDGQSATAKIEELAECSITEALPRTVGFTSGKPGRYQLLYQVPEEYWQVIRTKKIKTGTDGDLVELRWTGTQSVIMGHHPETGAYSWLNAPWDCEVAQCPLWVIEAMLDDTPVHVSKPRSFWRVERPLEQAIPLEKLLAKSNCVRLENGAADGERNDGGAALARDLIGCEDWAKSAGVAFEGSAEELFYRYAAQCGMPSREAKTIWRSAQKGTPTPSRSDEGLRRAVGWWGNQFKKTLREQVNMAPVQAVGAIGSEGEGSQGKGRQVRVTGKEIIERVRAAEIEFGFETSDYLAELYNLSGELNRPVKALQQIYQRSLADQCKGESKSFKELSKQKLNDVQWLIPDLLYKGSTTILHADGGAGKTLLAYNLIEALSKSGDFLGQQVTRKIVCGLIQTDEPDMVTTRRIEDLGMSDTENQVIFDWSFQQIPTLDQWIQEFRLEVLVIDSLFACQRYAETSENDADHAAPLMRLRDVAQRTGCSIIIIHHSNKKGEARGSGAIKGAVSEMWHLTAPVPEKHGQYKLKPSERIFYSEKTRMITPFKAALELDGETLKWRHLGDLTKVDNGTINEPATITERIKAFLSTWDSPFSISDLIDRRIVVGFERQSIRNALGRMSGSGYIEIVAQGTGKTETIWESKKFRQISELSGNKNPESQIQQGLRGNSPDNYLGNSEATHQETELATHLLELPTHQETELPLSCLGELPPNVYPESDTALDNSPTHQKSEIFERLSNSTKPEYVPTPSNEYTGPPVGAIVRFSDQGVAPAEIKRLRQKGTEYPWGLTGRIGTVYAIAGNRWAATVLTEAGKVFTVKDFLAIEVLEIPEQPRGQQSTPNQPWDDSSQPELEF